MYRIVCVINGEEYDCIYSFLETGTYPLGIPSRPKSDLCGGNVRTMRSIAAYSTVYRKKEKERGEMEFLRVPRGVEERERILHSCHSSKESMISSVMD